MIIDRYSKLNVIIENSTGDKTEYNVASQSFQEV